MSDVDDDLPVLTQVLRTGNRRRDSARPVADPRVTVVDGRRSGDHLRPDPREVDNAPRPDVEGYLSPSAMPRGDEPHEESRDGAAVVHGAHLHAPDAFRLPQDHGALRTMRVDGTFEEPELARIASIEAAQLREAILEDLRARIDTELDARIAQTLHAEVESAIAQLQVNLRARLDEALRDVVGRAVDEEIARLIPRVSTDERA